MGFHVHECAKCGKLTEGAAWYLSDAPHDTYGRITPDYRDSDPPRFCSEECRAKYEVAAMREHVTPKGIGPVPCDYHVEEGPVAHCSACREANEVAAHGGLR